MQNFKIKKNTYLFLFVFILAYSCCDPKESNSYSFNQKELQIYPYKGGEVLVYKNITNDSIAFNVTPKNSTSDKTYDARNRDKQCEGDYISLERNIIGMETNDRKYRMEITLYMHYDYPTMILYKIFELNCYYNHGKPDHSFTGTSPFFTNDSILNKSQSFGDTLYTFHKNIKLGNIGYENVYEMKLKSGVAINVIWFRKVYYNVKFGILGLAFNDGTEWYLNN